VERLSNVEDLGDRRLEKVGVDPVSKRIDVGEKGDRMASPGRDIKKNTASKSIGDSENVRVSSPRRLLKKNERTNSKELEGSPHTPSKGDKVIKQSVNRELIKEKGKLDLPAKIGKADGKG
jgi:hypothetical protein